MRTRAVFGKRVNGGLRNQAPAPAMAIKPATPLVVVGKLDRDILRPSWSCSQGRVDSASFHFAAHFCGSHACGSSRDEPAAATVSDGSAEVLAHVCRHRLTGGR